MQIKHQLKCNIEVKWDDDLSAFFLSGELNLMVRHSVIQKNEFLCSLRYIGY